MSGQPPERGPCVVLNNQHQDRLEEYLSIHNSEPTRVVLFQPYTKSHLRQVHELLQSCSGPVPIFFVVGNYGGTAAAAGQLHLLEYREEISAERVKELEPHASKEDK